MNLFGTSGHSRGVGSTSSTRACPLMDVLPCHSLTHMETESSTEVSSGSSGMDVSSLKEGPIFDMVSPEHSELGAEVFPDHVGIINCLVTYFYFHRND